MNREETPSIVPLSGSSTTTSLGGETITPTTATSTAYGYPSGSAWHYTTETETFDHLADHNLIGGLTMP
jgi:hypothetical protein